MADLSRGERLQIMLSPEELKALDDWRFETRMPSRAAAIRELLRRGLQGVGFDDAQQGSRSADFGVLSDSDNLQHDGDGRRNTDRRRLNGNTRHQGGRSG